MFYYIVPAKTVKKKDGVEYYEPDCEVSHEIMRFYRDHDNSFVIGTVDRIADAKEIKTDDPIIKSRVNWNKYICDLKLAEKTL
jgi:hypothetical protein